MRAVLSGPGRMENPDACWHPDFSVSLLAQLLAHGEKELQLSGEPFVTRFGGVGHVVNRLDR